MKPSMVLLVFLISSASAQSVSVANVPELNSALSAAKPGDEIVITATGALYWGIVVAVSGTAQAPITLRMADPEEAWIAEPGRLEVRDCAHVVIQFMSFKGCKDGAMALYDTAQVRVTECTFTECTGKDVVRFGGSTAESNRLDHCVFIGNAAQNVKIVIGASGGPRNTRIDGNTFRDVPPLNGNGRETIQIGQDQVAYGLFDAGAIVEDNTFLHCDGEAEIISNKSTGNTYRNNVFTECAGELVMRGGSKCAITGNRFERCSGGIRLSGHSHVVRDNTVIDSKSTGIRLMYGMADAPPAFYPAVYGCVIERNTIVGAEGAGIFVGGNRDHDCSGGGKNHLAQNPERFGTNLVQNVAPHDNRIVDNVIRDCGAMVEVDGAPDNEIARNGAEVE